VVERIAGMPAMAEPVLWHPTPDLVTGLVDQTSQLEVVHDDRSQGRMAEA
jgi:hypothetical protein